LAYDIVWHEKVKSDLASLTKEEALRVIASVKDRLVRDPSVLGKPLKGILKGLFRYRVGPYRVIYAIDHAEHRVIVLHVKHRKDAYR
jgi:mRNA interferase RelE/StbE